MHPGKRMMDSERRSYRSSFQARAIDWNPSETEAENVSRIYKNEMARFRAKDEELNKEYLTEFQNNVKILLKTPKAFESQKGLPATQRLEKALAQLGEQGYTTEALPKILDWALSGKYIADQVKSM
jgi:hypothetical protein